MVPIREVAKWRSYVNIAATTGRSLGGPIGGFLADTIGWRWSFLIQCPPTLLALILVSQKLHIVINDSPCKQSHLSKLKRIDFLGCITLCICIVCGLLVLDLGGTRMPWTEPLLLTLLGVAVAAGITDHASVTAAGAHLMPSVMGNALGGLLAGHIIHRYLPSSFPLPPSSFSQSNLHPLSRTGHYHPLLLLSALSSLTAYTLLYLRWHGHTSLLESLYIIPGGFGNGIALSAFFVSLTSGVEPEEMAIASSGLYLSSNVGMLVGLSVADCIMRRGLDSGLRIALEGWHKDRGMRMGMGRREIIRRAGSDVEFVRGLQGELGRVVRGVWVGSLGKTHVVSIVGALMALVAACCVREHRL
ncbi:major facilitator superfamily transporter protein [Rutstroemia sp. NJR-2017a BBW]|nr:major facilitator superfamily transporter protein [Rutstroemia sp. NJR-2017a BBW]